jgi:hypothetical protein
MKKISVSFGLLLISFSLLPAQSLDDILTRHAKAMGYDGLAAVRTARISGMNTRGKGGVPFTILIKGQKIRYESDMKGRKIVQVYDGRQGWFVSPRSGEVRAMPQRLVQMLEERARLGGYLARWKEVREYLTLEGSKDLKVNKEKIPVYKVRMEIPDVSVTDFYIDKKNYLLLRETEKTYVNSRQVSRKVDYGDYHKVDGVMIAFQRKNTMDGAGTSQGGRGAGGPGGHGGGGKGRGAGMGGGPQGGPPAGQSSNKTVMQFDKVEFNVPVDDFLFLKESLR